MSTIGALSSVMTQAMQMKPPQGPLPGAQFAARDGSGNDGDGAGTPPAAGSSGKRLDITA
jgi:hypothetical protein